jgi:geranylgeranyl pyrophosphate synthase
MEPITHIEERSSADLIPGRLADKAGRSDFLFRPDPWINGMVASVENLLQSVVSTDSSQASPMGRHMLFGYAKRLRPIFVILSQHLFNDDIQPGTVECAAASELIHCASLFHDDVIDEADTRRGRKSANVLWGNKQAVIAGDHFFVLAYDLLIRLRDLQLLNLYVDMCRSIAEGIMAEIRHTNDFGVSEKTHLEIITRKTAVFFQTTALAGGYIGGATTEQSEYLAGFGLNFGLAFQLMDDLLDLLSDPSDTGKPRGSDLKSGIFTIPVIHALSNNPDFSSKYKPLLKPGMISQADVDEIARALKSNGAIDYTKSMVCRHSDIAFDYLDSLPQGRANNMFRDLLKAVISRKF